MGSSGTQPSLPTSYDDQRLALRAPPKKFSIDFCPQIARISADVPASRPRTELEREITSGAAQAARPAAAQGFN